MRYHDWSEAYRLVAAILRRDGSSDPISYARSGERQKSARKGKVRKGKVRSSR